MFIVATEHVNDTDINRVSLHWLWSFGMMFTVLVYCFLVYKKKQPACFAQALNPAPMKFLTDILETLHRRLQDLLTGQWQSFVVEIDDGYYGTLIGSHRS